MLLLVRMVALSQVGVVTDTVRLWDAETGDPIRTLTGHTDWVWSVSFSPDGRTIASGSRDDTVRFWDVETGEHIRTLTGHTSVVWSVSFSPDGRTLASGSDDNTVRLWDVATGTPIRTLTGHTGSVESVSFSPDGRTIASGSSDRTVRLWDVETGDAYPHAHRAYGWGLECSLLVPMVALSQVGVVTAPCVSGMRRRASISARSQGIRVWSMSVSFSPDGRTIASGSYDNTVRLWDAETGEHIRTLTGHTRFGLECSF